MPYTPNFTANAKIINLVAEISEQAGVLFSTPEYASFLNQANENLRPSPSSRYSRSSRILDANALKLYQQLENLSPFSKSDFEFAQQILAPDLMKGSKKAKKDKKSGSAKKAALPGKISGKSSDLLIWLKNSKDHPLLKSSLFHFELHSLAPSANGAQQMGCLWQTLILAKWKPEFATLPVEPLVQLHQKEYQQTFKKSLKKGDPSPFVKFILGLILVDLQNLRENVMTGPEATTPEDKVTFTPYVNNPDTIQAKTTITAEEPNTNTPDFICADTPEVKPELLRMLQALTQTMSRSDLMAKMGLKDEKHFRLTYIQPGLAAGVIERTIPDKPNSRLQQYRMTEKGREIIRITL